MNTRKFLYLLTFIILASGSICVNAESEPDSDSDEIISWSELTNVSWVLEDGYYQAKFTDRQKELDGKVVVIEGFMFPLEFTRKHRNFLVSAAPMGSCFFCGPGEAESMIYVESIEDVEQTNETLKVRGTFNLVTDPMMGILYELKEARPVN